MRALVALAVAVALSGCTESVSDSVSAMRGGGIAEPYFMTYRDDLTPSYERTYRVPVAVGALALQIDVDLRSKAALDAPPAATLTVKLLSPAGDTLVERAVDGRSPTASLGATQLPPGEYALVVSGTGAPDLVDTAKTGAYYTLAVEVVYS